MWMEDVLMKRLIWRRAAVDIILHRQVGVDATVIYTALQPPYGLRSAEFYPLRLKSAMLKPMS